MKGAGNGDSGIRREEGATTRTVRWRGPVLICMRDVSLHISLGRLLSRGSYSFFAISIMNYLSERYAPLSNSNDRRGSRFLVLE